MFIPKHYGGSVCFGCTNMECECLGIEKDFKVFNKDKNACSGIPYKCQEINSETEEKGEEKSEF